MNIADLKKISQRIEGAKLEGSESIIEVIESLVTDGTIRKPEKQNPLKVGSNEFYPRTEFVVRGQTARMLVLRKLAEDAGMKVLDISPLEMGQR